MDSISGDGEKILLQIASCRNFKHFTKCFLHPRLTKTFETYLSCKKLQHSPLLDILLFLNQFAERRNQVVNARKGRGYAVLL